MKQPITITQSTVEDISVGPLQLTSGETLHHVTLRYERVGPRQGPTILVCHALTGNHYTVGNESTPGWWSGLIGQGKHIDTTQFQVLTFNVLGGSDGSTGPLSINPNTKESYRMNFPEITVQDMVHAQFKALQKLEIKELAAIIGGSLGGMQVMEWGLLYPNMTDKLIILAATPYFSDYGIAFNHIAAEAIRKDPQWNGGNYDKHKPLNGLEIARMVGMVTYRSPQLFAQRFDRNHTNNQYDVMSYLNYQGDKLANRFDPNSYLILLNAMNHHDIGKNRGGWEHAAKKISQSILLLSYDKDLVYEPHVIQQFASNLPNTSYHHIATDFGHDGFLTEFSKWGGLVKQFL
ncbi:homoserine O-acetyltransferase MetX [Oceanobacillus halotolerans]|uniref:homoserine O-acetyltransferase MetX n=1 Tax=Oceanobacillus halotolerans TaxID=2663380 RepID=UPI0013D95864|nr:homoserine O-acetyltransferase [Oceanobacillus halotolerans]